MMIHFLIMGVIIVGGAILIYPNEIQIPTSSALEVEIDQNVSETQISIFDETLNSIYKTLQNLKNEIEFNTTKLFNF